MLPWSVVSMIVTFFCRERVLSIEKSDECMNQEEVRER